MSASLLIPLVAATLMIAAAPASAATISVNCNTGGNLQSKLTSAPAGSTILIKGACHGNFSFGGKALTLKGNPSATLDGMNGGITLLANSPGDVVHLINLNVTGGFYVLGAGILSIGPLTLKNVKVTGNEATSSSEADGGGILAIDKLTIDSSTVSGNRASAVGNGAIAAGAGIFAIGNTTITNSVISGNVATALSGSGASEVDGSAISASAKLTIKNSKITNNRAGGSGDGSASLGAAIDVDSSTGAAVSLTKTTVSGNQTSATSATSSSTTAAGTVVVQSADLTVSSSKITGNSVLGSSPGSGGTAIAGGIYATQKVTVKGSSVTNNAVAGAGVTAAAIATSVFGSEVHVATSTFSGNVGTSTSSGGAAQSIGGIYAGTVTLSGSTVNGNALTADATGGSAAAYGNVYGVVSLSASTVSRNGATAKTRTNGNTATALAGGLFAAGTATNSTIALNHVNATAAGATGTATALGGGAYDGGGLTFKDVTLAGNKVTGSGNTLTREGGGLAGSAGTQLTGTIIGTNSAPLGPDCFGGPTSNGHNLIGKTAGCTFSKKSSDKVNKSPKLGTLKNNGGPTQTMAIAATSPARNAGVCPPNVDQRGVHRPQGSKCDIGAFELKASEASSSITLFKLPAGAMMQSLEASRSVSVATITRTLRSPDPTAFLDRVRGLGAFRLRLP
jgi:hypothetical protein